MNDYWFYAVSIFLLVEEYRYLLTMDKNADLERAFELKKLFSTSREELIAKGGEMVNELNEVSRKEFSRWKGVWRFIQIIWMIIGLFSQFTTIFVILIIFNFWNSTIIFFAKTIPQYKKLRYFSAVIYTIIIGYLLYFGFIIKFI